MTSQRGYSPSEWEHFRHQKDEAKKKPDRFILPGKTFYVEDWVELYDRFLRELEQRCPCLFHQLPETDYFNRSLRTPRTRRFTRIRADIEDKSNSNHGPLLELPGGDEGFIYCKGSMDVKPMFSNILKLLKMFCIPESEMVIYLRED